MAELQCLIVRRRSRKLFERHAGGVQDLADRLGTHPLYVAQAPGNIDNHALGGLLGQPEIARCLVALLFCLRLVLLRDAALLDRETTLPIGKPGQTQRQDQPDGEAAGDNVPAPRRGLPRAGRFLFYSPIYGGPEGPPYTAIRRA